MLAVYNQKIFFYHLIKLSKIKLRMSKMLLLKSLAIAKNSPSINRKCFFRVPKFCFFRAPKF